ncbi:MAG: hypothetical protein A3F78_05865 [Burkholderiales bacterium RIFCSPLOWO2_12_FULL_61_40]|nr:MAG: hypothetical protein A3F78_05865 [Burkholderiales bacterium RIFCSPLOWO2_12_FULL_61_40]
MQASTPPAAPHQALYRATLEEAAAGGAALMGKLVAATGRALYTRELTARTVYERDALIVLGKLLQGKDAELRSLYPKALLAVFTNPEQAKKSSPRSMAEVHFDQLELMDEGQVQESVAMARAQQVALMAVDASLADLNTLICSTLGMRTVRPESNPLRPEAYVNALKQVVEKIDVPGATRMDWISSMSVALGPELNAMYRTLAEKLRSQGVAAAGYAVVQAAAGAGVGVPGSVSLDMHYSAPPAWAPQPRKGIATGGENSVGLVDRARSVGASAPEPVRGEDDALLTLDKLRRLLSGDLEPKAPANRLQSFAQQFARQFEEGDFEASAPVSDFASTVPAAFEALAEMKQIDQVVRRLEQRQGAVQAPGASDDSPVEAIRDVLRRTASGVAQALSLEVVTLMVDNMVRNPRLLEPIQRLIAELEPALLLLSLVDPRFFTDKQHPARELLQEITHRSLAYESVQASGFSAFVTHLEQVLAPLASATIENTEPFERVLAELRETWRIEALDKERAREAAVKALQHAEQRNLLAEKIARKIDDHPDAARVPEVVIDFLCGPWAQVVAQARIVGGADSKAADKYQALISALLWSAHPELAHKNIAKLTRLVPLLLATLRDGLETIHYPATKTSAFFEALMGLHQLAFQATGKSIVSVVQLGVPPKVDAKPPTSARARQIEDGNPWVAPEEAQASNFMELPELPPLQTPDAPAVPVETFSNAADVDMDSLPLGSWVELLVNDHWVRTQLTWASPHGTLFLFTSVFGTPQSMTRRSRDKLAQAGQLRVVNGQTVVDGALDAVAQIAMRNSVDTTF